MATSKGANKNTTLPSSGERRAVGGFGNQYKVAANIILDHLKRGDLLSIKIADPDAGRVDDFQIASRNRIDAYQVKWTKWPGNLTLTDLTKNTKDEKGKLKPNLIAQLADGWKKIKSLNVGRSVFVHLVTSDQASNTKFQKDSLPYHHLAFFLSEEWGKNPTSADRGEFAKVWHQIQTASALADENEFRAFVESCIIETSYRLPVPEPEHSINQDYLLVDQIHNKLFNLAEGKTIRIELDHAQLLNLLGWPKEDFKNRHEFVLNELNFNPNVETEKEVEQKLSKLDQGYLILLGQPGTGKSTLLTRVLASRKFMVVSYYVYLPDTAASLRTSGEAQNFLHDIILGLNRAGYRHGQPFIPNRLDQQQECFQNQMKQINSKWLTTGVRTVLLIDGLDHIDREQHASYPLYNCLPHPDSVLPGLIFVLGTQTDSFIPIPIRSSVREDSRRINIKPLPAQAVRSILQKLSFETPLTENQIAKSIEICSGHPLFLQYLIQRMKIADSAEQRDALIESMPSVGGDIEKLYESYWAQISNNQEQMRLFSLLSRLRRSFRISWLTKWCEAGLLQSFFSSYQHLFRVRGESWNFFHNSFRIFLVTCSAKVADQHSPELDCDFHAQLAAICELNSEDYWNWEVIWYLSLGNGHEKLLQLAVPSYFRKQFFELRPVNDIVDDIVLALKLAAKMGNAKACANLYISFSEFSHRKLAIDSFQTKDSVETYDYLLALIMIRLRTFKAWEYYVHDGYNLKLDTCQALSVVLELLRCGHLDRAKELFDISTPVKLISKERIRVDLKEFLCITSKVKILTYSQSLEELVELLSGVQVSVSSGPDDEVYTEEQVRSMLFGRLGAEIIKQNRWSDFCAFLAYLPNLHLSDSVGFFEAISDKLPTADAAILFKNLAKDSVVSIMSRRQKLLFALRLIEYNVNPGLANKILDDVELPIPEIRPSRDEFRHFNNEVLDHYLFRKLEVLCKKQQPKKLTLKPGNYHDEFVDRESIGQLCSGLSRIASLALPDLDWRASKKQIHEVVAVIYQFVVNDKEWSPPPTGIIAAPIYLMLLVIEAESKHALDSLCEIFAEEWKLYPEKWPASLQQRVLKYLAEFDAIDHTWIVSQCLAIEHRILLDRTEPSVRISTAFDFVNALLLVGEVNDEKAFQKILTSTFSTRYGADDEVPLWLDFWRISNNDLTEEAIRKKLIEGSRFLSILNVTANISAVRSAAISLLALAYQNERAWGFHIAKWICDNEILAYAEVVSFLTYVALDFETEHFDQAKAFVLERLFLIKDSEYSEVMDLLVRRIVTLDESNSWRSQIDDILNVIPRSNEGQRYSWVNYLAAILVRLGIYHCFAQKLASLNSDPERNTTHGDKNLVEAFLLLDDEQFLSNKQVCAQVKTADDLLDYMKKCKNVHEFDWSTCLAKFPKQLTSAQVQEILSYFSFLRGSQKFYASLSRASESIDDARKNAFNSLEFNWYVFAPGWKALKEADPDRFNASFLPTFVEELNPTAEAPFSPHSILDLLELTESADYSNTISTYMDNFICELFVDRSVELPHHLILPEKNTILSKDFHSCLTLLDLPKGSAVLSPWQRIVRLWSWMKNSTNS